MIYLLKKEEEGPISREVFRHAKGGIYSMNESLRFFILMSSGPGELRAEGVKKTALTTVCHFIADYLTGESWDVSIQRVVNKISQQARAGC